MEGVQRLRDLLHILKQQLVKDKRARVTVATFGAYGLFFIS